MAEKTNKELSAEIEALNGTIVELSEKQVELEGQIEALESEKNQAITSAEYFKAQCEEMAVKGEQLETKCTELEQCLAGKPMAVTEVTSKGKTVAAPYGFLDEKDGSNYYWHPGVILSKKDIETLTARGITLIDA